MNMIRLKEELKKNIFRPVYLFYGEEQYLLNYYLGEIQKKLIPADCEIMNMSLFEGEDILADQIIESAQAVPFMNDKRLIIVKNSGFYSKRKKDAELIYGF